MSDVMFPLQLSLLVSAIATTVVAILGTATGYVLARMNFPGKSALDALCTLPLVLPPTVVGFYLLELLGRRGWLGQYVLPVCGWSPLFTWQAAVIAASVIAFPIMVKTSKAAIESVNQDYERVAFSLGKGRLATIFLVTLPLAWRGIAAGVALSFARALGEFGATIMVAGNIPERTQTMPLAIYQAIQTGNREVATTLVILLTITSLVILYSINRLGSRW